METKEHEVRKCKVTFEDNEEHKVVVDVKEMEQRLEIELKADPGIDMKSGRHSTAQILSVMFVEMLNRMAKENGYERTERQD